ncbi:6156_t:CDS:2, partial [Entrophospora sp. SA101]
TVLSENHITDNPDVDVVGEVIEKIHNYGETWSDFCMIFPTEVACRRSYLREGKIEDNLTLKEILEKGYEGCDSIKLSCYDYYDL